MMLDLEEEPRKIVLKLNYSKTKYMMNTEESKEIIQMAPNVIEKMKEYLFLGQIITLNMENQTTGIKHF